MQHSDRAEIAASNDPAPALAGDVLAALGGAIGKLRYGVVQLTVHDGKVVQLDVTERQRFAR